MSDWSSDVCSSDLNQVVSTAQLIEHAWDSNADVFPDSLKYHIHAIKRKLAEAGCREQLISNVRGVGYMVEDRP